MAYIVLLSVILLSSTISVGKEIPPLELCIIRMSSHYSSVSQYCTSHSIQTRAKEDVCKEIFQLFDKMCSFNISATAFHKPEPQNVSETNCVPLCAELDTQYITLMFDGSTGSCKTLCTKDLEAVAVLSTLFQLKDVIAGLKEKEKQLVETVTNSTLVELQQSTSSSGAVVNASIEPNAKPTTAAVVNASIEPNTKPTTAVVVTVPIEPNAKPATAVVVTVPIEPNAKPATAVVVTVPIEPNAKPATAVVVTVPIEPNAKPATAESVSEKELVATARSSTVQLQQSSSTKEAEGENDSKPNEADITLEPVITVATEKNPAPNVKPTTTVTKERMVPRTKPGVNTVTTAAMHPSSTEATEKSTTATDATVKKTTLDVKPTITVATEKNPAPNVKTTTTEQEAGFHKTDTSDATFRTKTIDDFKGLNKDNEILSSLENKHSNTNEEEETSRLDGTSNTDEKDETSRLDDTPSSYHFLIYFLAFIVLCVAAYIVFHNKHKIIAFIIEGKQGRRGGRPSTKQYTPLKSKVEDVMPFIEKSTSQSNYIY